MHQTCHSVQALLGLASSLARLGCWCTTEHRRKYLQTPWEGRREGTFQRSFLIHTSSTPLLQRRYPRCSLDIVPCLKVVEQVSMLYNKLVFRPCEMREMLLGIESCF